MLHVKDFLHYLYVAAPVSFTHKDCEPYKMFLDSQVGMHTPAINSVSVVLRENLYGFTGNKQHAYIKITVTDPKYINKVRTTIEEGKANWKGMWRNDGNGILTFDSIQYVLRFMVDVKVCSFALFIFHLVFSSQISYPTTLLFPTHLTTNLTNDRFMVCHGLKLKQRNTK